MNEPNEIYVVEVKEENGYDGRFYWFIEERFGFWFDKEDCEAYVNKLNGQLKAAYSPYYYVGVLNNALTLE